MSASFNLLHPGIQRALWDLKWKELRKLQVRAIETFFSGSGHIVLAASTASGKTEAAFLPVLSAVADEPEGSVRAMYVGPLKALINDQFRRLEELCLHAAIPVHRWHGDVSATDKEHLRTKPGGVLLITPESLESAFINYGNRIPEIFPRLDYVVIDELHSFIGDVRGVHLRSLLLRLAQMIGRKPRMLGLSATLADFESARRFLDSESPDLVEVIEDEETSRSIRVGLRAYPKPAPRSSDPEDDDGDARTANSAREVLEDLTTLTTGANPARWNGPQSADEETALSALARDLALVFGKHANLIFTNSRSLAEILADELNEIAIRQRWPRNPFLLHHGSLSKDVREDVEHRLKLGEAVSVFCTSTLEMGIDIGSVHSVGQLGPTWSVASLVQRMGRSGRHEGESSILRLYSLDSPPSPQSSVEDLLCPQLLRSIALVELLLARWLEPADSDCPQFSTLIHQILSVLRQTGGSHAKQLHEVLVRCGAFSRVTAAQFSTILRSLGSHEMIEQMPTGEIILAPLGEAITHAKEFYAAFTGVTEYLVRSGQTDIGKLPELAIPPEGEHLLLNGRRWKVELIDSRALVVEVVPARGRKVPLFGGTGGTIHRRIAEKMAEILHGDNVPAYLQADAALLLEGVRNYARKNRILDQPWLERGGSCLVFPWTGSKGMLTLRYCAKSDGIDVDMGLLSITYRCDSSKLSRHFMEVEAGKFEVGKLAAAMPNKHRDKFDRYLTDDLLDISNSMRALSLCDAIEAVKRLPQRSPKGEG